MREAAAAGILQVGKKDTKTNLADLFTKVLFTKTTNTQIVAKHYVPAVTVWLLRFSQLAVRLHRYLLGIGATMTQAISCQDQIQIAGNMNSREPRKVGWTDVVVDTVRIDEV